MEGERQSSSDLSAAAAQLDDDDHRIKLNVGGKLFETTLSTLRSGGPDSVLAAISSSSSSSSSSPIFIDRDPEIFSVLLSLLRTKHLPSSARRRFSPRELADESLYYGIESRLRSALSPPPFSGFDASLVSIVRPAADAFPSCFITTTSDGDGDGDGVWIAHAGQISAYDWTLARSSTLRTHLDHITSIRPVCPNVAAVASRSAAGLHFYDVSGGRHLGTAHWTDPSDTRIYKALVTAIAAPSRDSAMFASFECRHGENCILAVDKSTLQAAPVLGRQPGTSNKTAAPTKLTWLPGPGLLAASLVTRSAFGYAGYIRLWDPRSGDVAWETYEPAGSGRSSRFGDPFADVDADAAGSALFKVCSKSGDVAGADLRKLGEDPWVYLEEKNPSLRPTGGAGASLLLHCYRKQVFVARDAGLEVWSRFRFQPDDAAPTAGDDDDDDEYVDKKAENESGGGERGKLWEGAYRRVHMDDKAEDDTGRGMIQRIEGGGNRLFVSREGVEGIEVWESSHLSGALSLLRD